MAVDFRHAAGGSRYEVHEILEGDPALDLGLRYEAEDFGAAVDFAFDFLERRDPRREGAVSALEIVRVDGSSRETVWNYSHSAACDLPRDPVGVWGCDVTRRWQGPYRAPVQPPARPRTAYH
jgi:hypothetical protein